jgi:hypothetical protein
MMAIKILLLFAPLVLMPLILSIISKSPPLHTQPVIFKILIHAQPFAAVTAVISFCLPSGILAGAFAAVWLLFCITSALFGAWRFFNRGIYTSLQHLEEVCIDVGLAGFAIGGGWLVISRTGLRPLGFNEIIILLTSVHFHYAGGSAQIISGLVGKLILPLLSISSWMRKVYTFAVLGIIAGPPLLGAGITFSPLLEWVAALLLITSVLSLATVILGYIFTVRNSWVTRIFFTIASGSVFFSMFYALLYAWGEWTGQSTIGIFSMVHTHGVVNVFGFVLCSLLALLYSLSQPSRIYPS